jgi:hypothetical protein
MFVEGVIRGRAAVADFLQFLYSALKFGMFLLLGGDMRRLQGYAFTPFSEGLRESWEW